MRTIEAIKNAPVSPAKEAIYILYFSVKLLVLSHYFIIVQCCFVDVHILLTAVFFVFFLLFVKLYVCIPQSPERCRVVQQKQKPVTWENSNMCRVVQQQQKPVTWENSNMCRVVQQQQKPVTWENSNIYFFYQLKQHHVNQESDTCVKALYDVWLV